MKTVAVLLAGGSGNRFGSDIPKQFLKVKEKMIIEYTIEAFQNHKGIDEIAVVCHPEYSQLIEGCVKDKDYSKVKKVLNGGSMRHHSSINAIKAYDDGKEKNILFHDAVRPLINNDAISNCIDLLNDYNAVGVGIPTTDTIWTVSPDNIIVNIPDRRTIYRAQTPQGFKLSTIRKAYEIALQDKKMISTDDCGVVMNYLSGEKIATVNGSESNIKITRKEDLEFFENFLAKENNSRI